MCFQTQEYLTPGVLTKFRPYRTVFIFISTIAIFFAVLIIVENIIFLSVASRQSIIFLLLPYLLSWVLIIFGCCFARFAYLLHIRDQKHFTSVLPLTNTAWTDSRPVSPSPSSPSIQENNPSLNSSYNTLLFRSSLTVPNSPFFISDTVMNYRDEPPSYSDIVDRGVSPVPPQPKQTQCD